MYALILLIFSAVGTTAIANTKVHAIFTEVASVIKEVASPEMKETAKAVPELKETTVTKSAADISAAAPMFATIILGADDVVTCSNDGATVARFNLCGDSDDRTISLSGASGPISWQKLGGSCSPDINQNCPNTTGSCYTTVGTGSTFNLDASGISATTGGEFRVVANGQPYYFKVKKSTITQSFVKNDFVCGVPGRIQITGLSSAYEFSIDNGGGFGPWQGPIFNNLMPNTYIVKARLRNTANTCEYPYAPILIEQQDIAIDVTFTDAQCSGETGTVTVTAGNVPGPFKYTLLDDTGTAQEFTAFIPDNPYTFSAVGFGTYTVQVETTQCTGDPLAGIDPPRQDRDTSNNPIIIGAGVSALDARAEPNNSFSTACGISSVDITVYTSGGTAPYTYIVNGAGPSSPNYAASRVETVNSPGTYEFLITDANGCTITASANVAELTPPDITVAGVDGTCTNGGARLEFSIIDAKGYDLQFRAAPGDPWSNNLILTVTAGAYNSIEVQYESGAFSCILAMPNTVAVTEVGTITGDAIKNFDVSCNLGGGTTGGEIEFTGPFTGGSGTGYQFSLDGTNFSATTLYSGLSAGVYNPVIIDDSGCRRVLTAITITGVTPPTNLDFAQSNINCGLGSSDVQLTPTSTNTISTYEIVSPITASNGTGLFTGLNTGTTYTFRITDDRNCSYTETFTPVTISSIRARVKSGGDLRVCTGATDGSGTYLIDGFGNNYTYNINGGPESAPQNDAEVDLPPSGAGTYVITVTDADTGCTDTASFDIVEPGAPIDLTGTVRDMSCANGNSGRVIGNATGGWGAYRYTLTYPNASTVGPRSNRTFNNLTAAGNYRLSVVDAEGCTDTFDFTLTQIDAPAIALDAAASDYCFVPGTGATVGVTSTAGSALLATHQYRINGGSLQGSPVFTGLTPGNYTIEVVDGNNCRDAVNVTVRPQLRVNTSIDTDIPCGGSPGQIRVSITGGYLASAAPKDYQVSDDNGATYGIAQPLIANSFLYPVTTGATYVFRVTDNEGCEAFSSPLVVDPAQQIAAAAVDVKDVSCARTDNGIVTIRPDATSGIPPYEVSFDGGAFTSQTVYSNLTVGTYPFVVRDARGCETPAADAVVGTDNTPAPDATVSELSATCSPGGAVSGGIRIDNVTNGSENFSFRIEDSTGTIVVQEDDIARADIIPYDITDSALIPGMYTVITLDANGCRDIDIVEITQSEVTVTPLPVPSPSCTILGFSETVDIVGGTGPFLIRLENDPAAPVSPNVSPRRHTFNGLQFGVTYTVEVTDTFTGCIYLDEIPPVSGPSLLAVTATSTPGACNITNRNGEITYEVTGFNPGTDNLRIELMDNEDGSLTLIETVTPVSDPYSNTYGALAGDYQIIVTNLTDNCSNATAVLIDENLPAIDILAEEAANCNAAGQITVQGRGGDGGPYEFAYLNQGAPEPSVADPAWTTETTFVAIAGNYDIYVRDGSGCTSFDIATVIQLDPDLVPPTVDVVNQCIVTATAFDITVSMPLTVNTPRFTLAGDTQLGTDIGNGVYEFTYQVASPGSYVVDVTDANGCTSQATAEVYEFLSAFGDFSTMPTCNAADGTITMNVIGGSNDFDYQLQDSSGTTDIGAPITGTRLDGIITGVAPGTYKVEVTDNETGCVFVGDVQLIAAIPPVINTEDHQDITCHDVNDGTINITLQSGTDVDTPIEFILRNVPSASEVTRNNAGSFDSLGEGDYQVEVLTARGCSVLSSIITIDNPADFIITANAPDFTCEPAANRFSSTLITVTVDGTNPGTVGGGYQYSIEGFTNYQTANTFEIVDDGTPRNITVYAIDGNGCQTTFDLPTINLPLDVVPTLNVIAPLNCANPEEVEISVTGTADFTVITTGPVTTSVADVSVIGGSIATVSLPDAGDYFFVVRDDSPGGCSYPLPVHSVEIPINPTVTITPANPVICAMPGNDGALFIEVSDYVGTYDYRVYEASDVGKTTIIATGNFDTGNFPDVNGDAARITGLPGGNYFVEVVATDVPFCSSDSGVATIRVPNGQLDVTAIEIGNVTCSDNLGTISATGSGGWDTDPYEYRLLQNGVEIVPFGTVNIFNNLSSGDDYQVEIRDFEGCTDIFDIDLPSIPAINAGIREPQNLVCPGGNNAVLEAFNMTTGNPGAEGGVSGAGYKYQLIYLDSDMTGMPTPSGLDERDRSGLQDSPTFTGTSGGVISAGWYAIEITSSFNCNFVTPPYEVIPPPPVRPRLVQTQVPGCGGRGEMELAIENPDPDPSVVYEYVLVENGVQIGVYADMAGTSFRFPGDAGITYQVDVRKKNLSNVCTAVRSNGITMTDASGITLLPNAPGDISCASENDGRIESFTNGGVGNEEFRLYIGDPVDAFSPDSGARLIRTQDFGTFEGLDEQSNAYYIAVTSGVTCSDIFGPISILRPDPIVFTSTETPVSCTGESDGSITLEVTSGGEGLIQFAIAPNFNEFFTDVTNPGVYTFEDLAAGDYEILIQDENGCFEKDLITVIEPAQLMVADVATNPETCISAADGSAQLTVTGGTPFVDPITLAPYYETKLMGPGSDGSEVFERNDNLFFDNLAGGVSYLVFIQDANRCETFVEVPIEIGVDLTAEPILQYGCEGIFPNSTTRVELQDTSRISEILFALDPIDPSDAITALATDERAWGDLPVGNHIVYIYHENGCTNTVEFEIDAYEPLTLDAQKTGPNELTAIAAGGFGGYEYFFNGQSYGSEGIYTTTDSGTVEVRVVDERGCVVVASIPFEFTGMLEIPNFFSPNGDNENDFWSPKNREFFPNIEVIIYDRYGRVVAELNQVSEWDGLYDGKELPSGDYWYVVNQNDKRSTRYVGHFTLYR
ncbi:gliding motility-associated C-terminal domain-containing protein [Pricia antarctica]|uniref:Gliding motility-associated C-terminal domain-containing protein n=1 Tax=Pricia antarctica TaxID=641691 RepID=A0A1G7FH73_9FLAO|nr:gliding motility-associated C-terminal domain-containing protein [Pricia antarctica]